MQAPPGSQPHPLGHDAVAFFVTPWRRRLLIGVAVGYGVLLLVLAIGVVVLAATVDVSFLGALALPALALPLWLLVLGQVLVTSGPVLVVDDQQIRLRDTLGWLQLPLARVLTLDTDRGGAQLELNAPEGIYLNDRRLRRSRQRYRLDGLTSEPRLVLAYLQHRWHDTAR